METLTGDERKQAMDFFKSLFPIIELPISVTKETFEECSIHNQPLPLWVYENIISLIDDISSEHIEYIPCFRFVHSKDIDCLLLAKIDLLHYQYILVSIDKKGLIIDFMTIAGLEILDDIYQKYTLARIENDQKIYQVESQGLIQDEYSTLEPKYYMLEIGGDGKFSDKIPISH